MIYPVTGWFEIMKYEYKKEMTTVNLVGLRGFPGTLVQQKLCMTAEENY